MKKYLNQALMFAIYGLCAGVYFREFTKFNDFTGSTMLGKAHPHILMLGCVGLIIVALFFKVLNLEENKKTKMANIVYISGVILASVIMLVRGTMEVSGVEITNMISGMLSGLAGIGHIAIAAGMIRYLLIFKKSC